MGPLTSFAFIWNLPQIVFEINRNQVKLAVKCCLLIRPNLVSMKSSKFNENVVLISCLFVNVCMFWNVCCLSLLWSKKNQPKFIYFYCSLLSFLKWLWIVKTVFIFSALRILTGKKILNKGQAHLKIMNIDIWVVGTSNQQTETTFSKKCRYWQNSVLCDRSISYSPFYFSYPFKCQPYKMVKHSNNSLAIVNKLFDCVLLFCVVGTARINISFWWGSFVRKCCIFSLSTFN